MSQQYILSGFLSRLAIFQLSSLTKLNQVKKSRFSNFSVVLFTCLINGLIPGLINYSSVQALDITQQLNRSSVKTENNYQRQNYRTEADKLLQISKQQLSSGFPEKALNSALQAMEIYHSLADMKSQGTTYSLLANIYLLLGNSKSAEDALRRELAIARDNQDLQNEIFALNNLGTLFIQKGENNIAEKFIDDALIISRTVDNIEGQGLSLSNLSLVAFRQGDYYKSIKLGEYALNFRRQFGDAIGEANTLNNLGDAYLAIGDYQNTISSYGLAMQLAKNSFERTNQIRAVDGLVAAHTAVGKYERALELLDRRVAISNFQDNPNDNLRYLAISGQIYEKMGQFAKAKDLYKQAINLAKKLEDSKQEAFLINKLNDLKLR